MTNWLRLTVRRNQSRRVVSSRGHLHCVEWQDHSPMVQRSLVWTAAGRDDRSLLLPGEEVKLERTPSWPRTRLRSYVHFERQVRCGKLQEARGRTMPSLSRSSQCCFPLPQSSAGRHEEVCATAASDKYGQPVIATCWCYAWQCLYGRQNSSDGGQTELMSIPATVAG